MDEAGQIQLEQRVHTSAKASQEVFGAIPRSRIALEIGTHSPWISRLLSGLGHEVIVAQARKVRLIGESHKKDDRLDAQTLARLARIDPQLLYPVQHRSAQAQADLTLIRARAGLVRERTGLVNTARGLAKSCGEHLRGCNVRNLNPEKAEGLSPELQRALEPLLSAIEELSQRIREYNERIEQLARQSYPQVVLLKQVKGVGTLIALTFLLTLEDPHRFGKSRDVGCYLGLQPGRRNSGQSKPQMYISKEGDPYLRTLLVQGHSMSWDRLGSTVISGAGPEASGTRWTKREEADDRCHGQKAGSAAASPVGERRSVRTLAQQQPHNRGGSRVKTKPKSKSFPEEKKTKAQSRVPVTASMAWPTFHSYVKRQGAKQMVAPAETRTPKMHRANESLLESADGSMATVATRREKNICLRKSTKNHLTPTGLLMEDHYTQNSFWPASLFDPTEPCAKGIPKRFEPPKL
jgi:transposase